MFNHDTVGLPQNEESVTVCGQTVLGGTNDFRSLLLTPPQELGAGWHLSTDNGRTLRNEGLLPPVTIAGQPVPARGDPVDVVTRGVPSPERWLDPRRPYQRGRRLPQPA